MIAHYLKIPDYITVHVDNRGRSRGSAAAPPSKNIRFFLLQTNVFAFRTPSEYFLDPPLIDNVHKADLM
jgi:hypothetical protein